MQQEHSNSARTHVTRADWIEATVPVTIIAKLFPCNLLSLDCCTHHLQRHRKKCTHTPDNLTSAAVGVIKSLANLQANTHINKAEKSHPIPKPRDTNTPLYPPPPAVSVTVLSQAPFV